MSESENVRTVQAAYQAFSQGDIQGVLDQLTSDVEWSTPGPREIISYAGDHHGHDEVAQFFSKLAEAEEIERFEPREFIAQGEKVVVLGNYAGRVKATEGRFDLDWIHVFTLRDGLINGFREFYDTAEALNAYRTVGARTAMTV